MGMIKKQIRNETVKQMHKKYGNLDQCISLALAPLPPRPPAPASAPTGAAAQPAGAAPAGSLSDNGAQGVGVVPALLGLDGWDGSSVDGVGLKRDSSSTNLKRDTSKSDQMVTGWLLKRSNTLRKWNTRYCEFCLKTGHFEWRKRPDDREPNGFMDINAYTEVQNKSLKSGPQGMEDTGFAIKYETKMYVWFLLSLSLSHSIFVLRS